jgi:hypothetical protein
MNSGKCPSCRQVIQSVRAEPMAIQAQMGSGGLDYNGVSYLCPSCSTILGVSVDPIALAGDLASQLAPLLGKR